MKTISMFDLMKIAYFEPLQLAAFAKCNSGIFERCEENTRLQQEIIFDVIQFFKYNFDEGTYIELSNGFWTTEFKLESNYKEVLANLPALRNEQNQLKIKTLCE